MSNEEQIHLGNKLDVATLDSLADFICGDDNEKYPVYRSSLYLTRFFRNIEINAAHDGTTRKWWVLEILKQLQPFQIEKVILRLSDLREYKGDKDMLGKAVRSMNGILLMDNLAVGFNASTPILKRGLGINLNEEEILKVPKTETESEFLNQKFTEDIKVEELGFDAVITSYLQSRVDEIQSCPKNKVALGSIFLLGSTLEGLLLANALVKLPDFMKSSSAPKEKDGSVKKIYDWKLGELIDVSHSLGLLGLDVKKFSHVLRDFRNYIHPYHQMYQKFEPDQNTVDICFQVFRAVFTQIKTKRVLG